MYTYSDILQERQEAMDKIVEAFEKIDHCPDWASCKMEKLERAERKEIELRNSLVIIADLLKIEVPFKYHNLK